MRKENIALITPKVYGVKVKNNTGSLKLIMDAEELKNFEEQVINEITELKDMYKHFINKKETYEKVIESLKTEQEHKVNHEDIKRCYLEIEQTETTISKIKKQLLSMADAELVTVEQNRDKTQKVVKLMKFKEIYKDWDLICLG